MPLFDTFQCHSKPPFLLAYLAAIPSTPGGRSGAFVGRASQTRPLILVSATAFHHPSHGPRDRGRPDQDRPASTECPNPCVISPRILARSNAPPPPTQFWPTFLFTSYTIRVYGICLGICVRKVKKGKSSSQYAILTYRYHACISQACVCLWRPTRMTIHIHDE